MIRGVLFVGSEPAGTAARLKRGGVQARIVDDVTGAAAAAAAQEWGLQPGSVLVIGHSAPSMISWTDVSHQGSSCPSSADQVMQAIVQHNRRHILAAATAGVPAAELQQQQQQQQRPAVLVVGYVMKPSREEQLASAGLLPLLPGNDGLCFMPFDVGQLTADASETATTESQQQQQQQQQEGQGHIDLLLHKGSDELVSGPEGAVGWSGRLLALQEWLQQEQQRHICVVDPFENTAKVLDRLVLGQLLGELQQLQLPPGLAARAPRYCQVDDYAAADLPDLLHSKGMRAPFIVKPVVACGVSHSHSMGLVLQPAALASLQGQLPLPAVVQEFVNHGGTQFKVYVLGEKVFITPRASIPDVCSSPSLPPQQQLLLFDSLASLPTQLPPHMVQQSGSGSSRHECDHNSNEHRHAQGAQQQQQQQAAEQPNIQTVEAIAGFLRSRLGLTLFGFDVVASSQPASSISKHDSIAGGASSAAAQARHQQQQLVVIDVNYFPNYRGGSNTPALFREALLQRWQQHAAALGLK